MSESCVTLDAETYELLQQELKTLRSRVAELEKVAALSDCTQQQLRESEAKFEKLAANVPGVIYQLQVLGDGSSCFRYVSPRCRELFEMEPWEILAYAAAPLNMNHPDDLQMYLDSVAAATKSLQPWRCEWRIITPSGKLKWIWGASRPEVQADGSILWDGLLMDITEKKTSEIKWRLLIQNSLDIITIQNIDGTFKYISPSAEQVLGYKPEELIGRNSLELIHPEDVSRVVAAFEQLIKTPTELMSIEPYRVRHAAGFWCYLETTSSNLLIEPSVAGIVANCRDVTERVYAESALRESEERYRSLVAALEEGIILQDADRTIRACNTSAERILGISVEEMMGRASVDLRWQTIHEDGSPFLAEEHPNIVTLRTGKPQSNVILGIHKADGTLTWICVNSQPLFRPDEDTPYAAVCSFSDITKRKAAEEALKKSEELYRIVARNFPNGSINLFDRDLRYTLADGTDLVKSGFPKEMWEGKTLWEVLPPDLCKQIEPFYHAALAGTSTVVEVPIGDQIYLSYYLPLNNEVTGEIFGGMVMSQNITAIKQAEADLKKSEALYRTMARNLPNGAVVLFDRDLRYTLADGTELAKVGVPKEMWEGKTLSEVMPPDVCQQVEPLYRKALAGEPTTSEMVLGDQIYLAYCVPFKNELTGEIFAGMSMTQNITAIKQTEAALRQSEAQLREQAQRAELLNQLASQIRNSLDLDTILQTTVQEIRDLLQVDRCNFLWYRPHFEPPAWEATKEAKPPHFPSQLGVYPASSIGPLNEKILEGKTVRVDEASTFPEPLLRQMMLALEFQSLLSLPITTRSGEIGIISCSHSQCPRPFSDREVELLQAVASQLAIAINQAELYAATDLAAKTAQMKSLELEKTLRELQRTQTHLLQSEKMSSLGQLVAGVAHEINNPVNFIYGNLTHVRDYSEDLLKLLHLYRAGYPDSKPEIEAALEEIDVDFIIEDLPNILSSMKIGAERIREIVLSLRNFSRLDEAQIKDVDIHQGLDSTLLILQNRLKPKPDYPGISVIKQYGKLPLVECHAGPLNQVFMNLINNAIDALEENRSRERFLIRDPEIHIATEVVDRNYVRIRIADNGPGMTEGLTKRVFDPFFTTKPVGKGTGLGLSISYQIIVEKHKGQLRCVSQIGVGTEFVIEIPIKQQP